jgi:hypothetical protein
MRLREGQIASIEPLKLGSEKLLFWLLSFV